MNLLEGKTKLKTAALLRLKHIVGKKEIEEVEKMGGKVGARRKTLNSYRRMQGSPDEAHG